MIVLQPKCNTFLLQRQLAGALVLCYDAVSSGVFQFNTFRG